MQHASEDLTPLYVRLPRQEADLLDRAAFEGKTSKRELVTDAVRAHLGLERGRVEFRPAPADPPPVLTLAEAADLLQVPEAAVEELADAGDLPGRKIAGDWRFARAAVLAWLAHSH
jgi:excisionase family DNA binding protein